MSGENGVFSVKAFIRFEVIFTTMETFIRFDVSFTTMETFIRFDVTFTANDCDIYQVK